VTRASAASRKRLETDEGFREIGVSASGMDELEVVHLLTIPPPTGGGICACEVCGLVFQSRPTPSAKPVAWVSSRRQHKDDSYHGRYRSCRPSSP
jgi:hypothetical protein